MTRRPRTRHDVPPAGAICRLPATELVERIKSRKLAVREVVSAFLDRIEAVNPCVNAIVSLRDRDDILRDADGKDALLAAGREAGPLLALPIAIKDLARRKAPHHLGLMAFADLVPQDAIFVERIRAADAIVIGKTNTPEFDRLADLQ